MLIDIGPWWLYDTIALAIIVVLLVVGMAKGTYVMLYFLSFNLVAFLFNVFLVPLIAQAISPALQGLVDGHLNVDSIMSSFDSFLSGFLDNLMTVIFGSAVTIDVNTSVFNDEIVKLIIAVILAIVFEFGLIIIFNGLAFTLYFCTKIRVKLINLKINRHGDILFGALLGIFWGFMWVFGMSQIVSLPVFKTNSQDLFDQNLGSLNFDDPVVLQEFKAVLEHGNRYKQKGISSKLSNVIPRLGINYSNECLARYVLLPVISVPSSQWENSDQIDHEVLMELNKSILDGYTSNSYFDYSAKACVDYGLRDVQPVLRIVNESILLMSSIADLSSTQTIPTPEASFNVLYTQLTTFMSNNNIERMGLNDFKQFFKQNPDSQTNEFIHASEALSSDPRDLLNQSEIINVLKDPVKLYNWLKNTYYVNQYDLETGTLTFVPSIYSALTIISGWEIVPSGLVSSKIGVDISPNNPSTNQKTVYNFEDYWAQIVDYTV